MKVQTRQDKLIQILSDSKEAVSGTFLAEQLSVSRQIIVKDITQLRESGHTIISTTKGYVLDRSWEKQRIFKTYHQVEETEAELNLIVDLGAEVRDVFIYHKVYGEIHAPLNIRSRKDASKFVENLKSGKSSPLMTATSGYHYHTIAASDDETLNMVEASLKEHGFLTKLTEYEPSEVVGL